MNIMNSKHDEKINIGHLSDLHTGYDHNTIKIHTKFFSEHKDIINSLDALIIAGDLISHSQHQFKTLFRNLRNVTDIPVLMVRGNHCFWAVPRGKVYPDYKDIIDKQESLFTEFNIHHLEKGAVTIKSATGSVKIWGFDGWYNRVNVESNDRSHMRRIWHTTPPDPFEFLIKKANSDFNTILSDVGTDNSNHKILVTHFPPINFLEKEQDHEYYIDQRDNGGIRAFLDPISENFNLVLMGHFHGYYKKAVRNCVFRTTGCNYNQPRLQVIDL